MWEQGGEDNGIITFALRKTDGFTHTQRMERENEIQKDSQCTSFEWCKCGVFHASE